MAIDKDAILFIVGLFVVVMLGILNIHHGWLDTHIVNERQQHSKLCVVVVACLTRFSLSFVVCKGNNLAYFLRYLLLFVVADDIMCVYYHL